MTPETLRRQSAQGLFDQPTSGFCDGYVQANLAAVPEAYAADFETFCHRNAQPCPLLEIVGPGQHHTQRLAKGADLLNVIPRYRVWENGRVIDEVQDISRQYQEDLVFFLLGCSFSFEEALVKAGIRLRHLDQACNVSMYRTNIRLESVGPFQGKMVVSMRPVHHRKVATACAVTAHFPEVHGAPVHVGYPEMIGINDLGHVDYGDAVEISSDEVPVFWACGVTPQNVLISSRIPFAITHAPGFMFVGDILNEAFARCELEH